MRIGYCLLMLSCEDDPLGAKWIPVIKEAGFDYAEIPLGKLYHLGDAEINAYKKEFEKSSLPVEVFNFSLPADVNIIGDDLNDYAVDYYINRAITLAEYFGVKVITSCGPLKHMVSKGFDWQNRGKAQYITFLQKIADAAAKKNITYAIEPICDIECGFINTTGTAIDAIEKAGRKNIKLIVDLFHFDRQYEDPCLLSSLASNQLCHLHFADLAERKIPYSTNQHIYQAQLMPIFAGGFNGRVSIEAFADHPETDIPESYIALTQSIKLCNV